MALIDKQQVFCREYLVDLKATQAAIRAGHSDKIVQYLSFMHIKCPILKEVNALKTKA